MLDLTTSVWEKTGPFPGMDELFRDVGLPSLMQPDNVPAAAKLGLISSYNFYATEYARGVISQSKAYHELERLVPVAWYALQGGIGNLTANILHQMKMSAEKGNHFLQFAADHVAGNKSILNHAQLCAEGKYWLILWTPPKVNPTAFEEIKERFQKGEVISNRKLVSIFMRHGCDCPGTITKAGPNKWLVNYRLPSPTLRPDQAIIDFWATNFDPHAGIDHALTIWMVDHGYPWLYIDHSDLFFMADRATPWLGGSAPWGQELLARADGFFRDYCQEHPVVWQGEEEQK